MPPAERHHPRPVTPPRRLAGSGPPDKTPHPPPGYDPVTRRRLGYDPSRAPARPAHPAWFIGHSRPTSRWLTWTSMPRSRRRAATCSAIATLRCLPPVQPTASVA